MAYYANQNLIINDKAAVVHESFPQIAGTIASTEVKIVASDRVNGDRFGSSVAIGSGRIVVGAYLDDDNGTSSGSAYIFDLDGNQLAKITASDAAASDFFGFSVAVGSGRIVVGAPNEDPGGISNAGAAYIFDLNGNQLAKITASDAVASDFFGLSVAVGSSRIVVGAPDRDDNGAQSGAVYIFDLDGNQLKKITASDGAASNFFGLSVGMGCGRIVVGAQGNASAGDFTGAAYIFDLNGNQIKKITASDPFNFDYFGYSVAIGSGRIVVGADGGDEGAPQTGAAYIFDLDGNQLAKISASDAATYNRFGWNVAVGSGRIVVGSPGDPANGSFSNSAYVFDLDGNELEKIDPIDTDADFEFGYFVAAASNRIVVGVDSTNANPGSAYIYSLSEDHNTYWERILDTYKY